MNGWQAIGWALLCWVPAAFGAEVKVPPPLEAWTGWALHGVEGVRCPHRFDADQPRLCAWPGPLILKADDSGVDFSQRWEVHELSCVPLPGSSRQWPQAVQVDGQPAAVVSRSERPCLWLGPGRHRIEGKIRWQTLPATLQVPPQTGRVELSVQGKPEPFLQLEPGGRLWLSRQPLAPSEREPQLKLQVFRLIEDEVPQLLTTRIALEVSGPMREVVLPQGIAGFTPFALTSPLPARLEPDGRLRLQLRPGSWQVEVRARSDGPRDRLELNPRPPPWPGQEIWSFAAHPELRIVREQGGRRIDPSLAEVPEAWQRHPAYLMVPGDALELNLIQRGSPAELQDALSLQRNLWLDFAGRGITVQDRIHGTLVSSSRLTAAEIRPGEARLDGKPALITVLEDDPRPGVEVRRGRLDAEVIGRYEGALANLPANGWAHRFQAAEVHLNLPPGWRVLAVSGADSAVGTWLERWTLLDLFLVLILALAVLRLSSWPWGAVALLGLTLSWHEPGAPRYLWLNLVMAVALARWLPVGRVRRWARSYHAASISALVLAALPFFVYELRAALYPQLEHQEVQPPPLVPVAIEKRMEALAVPEAKTPEAEAAQPPPASLEVLEGLIQTGPGVPDWQWHSLVLRWSGPVEPGQTVRVWALGPVPTRGLRVLSIALVAGLLWRLAGFSRLQSNALAAQAGMLVLSLLPNHALKAQGFPDPALLEVLKTRLTEPAKCLPRCAELAEAKLFADPSTLRLNLEVHAAIETAVPLPEQAGGWTPAEVQVDGKRRDLLLRGSEGSLWLPLKPGVHWIFLAGPLPARDRIVVHFPLPPRRLGLEVNGWQVFGFSGEGSPAGEVELVRERPQAELSPLPLPSFARLERHLVLGREWYVHYRLARLSTPDEPLVLKIPLMDGESLITRDLEMHAGQVEVRLPPGQQILTWRTHLDPRSQWTLAAPPSLPAGQPAWLEVWRLQASPLWHVRTDGVPAVHPSQPSGDLLPEWRPWPGERLTLTVTRPQGVPGPTLTLDRVSLILRPGKQSQALELELQLHSSRGGIHSLVLPAGSVLEAVEIDGENRPLGLEQARLNLPVEPGSHQLRILWHHLEPVGYLLRTPEVDLGAPAANLNLRVELGSDRWVLAMGGPVLGPAVLFWGLMVVLAGLAWGLSRLHLTPLKAWQWFLLLLGLTQPPVVLGAIVVGWLLLLGVREKLAGALGVRGYNLIQLATAAATLLALAALFLAVRQGLLGLPDMQLTGHGSTASNLNWYQDRAGPKMPRAWVLWVPLWAYRVLMLGWALWLASALIGWLRWLWQIVTSQGLWRREPSVVSPAPNDSSLG